MLLIQQVGEADTGVMFSRLEGTGGSMDTIDSEVDYTHMQSKRADLPWHKPSKRKRRTSSMEPDPPALATIGDLSCKFSHLDMNHLPTIEQSPASKDRTEFLPPIARPRLPTNPCITSQCEYPSPVTHLSPSPHYDAPPPHSSITAPPLVIYRLHQYECDVDKEEEVHEMWEEDGTC